MCAADFVDLLEAFVPNHTPCMAGGEPDQFDTAIRVFEHGSSVVLWVEKEVADADRHDESSDCDWPSSGSHEDEESDGSLRSRSRRNDLSLLPGISADRSAGQEGTNKTAGTTRGSARLCIPTPCRSFKGPPVLEDSVDVRVGPSCCLDPCCELDTLLSKAARDWELVCCAAVEVVGNAAVSGRTKLMQLRLEECLPARTFDLTTAQAPIGRNLDDVCALLGSMNVVLSTKLPEGIQVHPATAKALNAICAPQCPVTPTPYMHQTCNFAEMLSIVGGARQFALRVASIVSRSQGRETQRPRQVLTSLAPPCQELGSFACGRLPEPGCS